MSYPPPPLTHLKKFAGFLFRLARNILRGRYIRLSPNLKGRICFYDRKFSKFFTIQSRGHIDSGTANQIYDSEDYSLNGFAREQDIIEEYERILTTGKIPLIYDCGGNIGLASRYFAENFPAARVICIEPEKGNMVQARKNCKKFDNVIFREAAIGSTVGFVTIMDENANADAFRVLTSEKSDKTEMVNIDQLLKENNEGSLFIVKIDIEGFEENLFSQNTEWIDDCMLLIVELHDWMLPGSANSSNFLQVISHKNRDFVHRGENIFSIRNS